VEIDDECRAADRGRQRRRLETSGALVQRDRRAGIVGKMRVRVDLGTELRNQQRECQEADDGPVAATEQGRNPLNAG